MAKSEIAARDLKRGHLVARLHKWILIGWCKWVTLPKEPAP